MRIHISTGNDKIGNTPNVSLPPIISCRNRPPCFDRCYAVKFYKGCPEARQAWDENWKLYNENWQQYFYEIALYINDNKPSYFRWHVSGDCPDGNYMLQVFKVCSWFPKTKFLMYTKQFDMLVLCGLNRIPNNLTVMLSMWPYLNVPNVPKRRIWITGDLRCPPRAFMCPGKCESCRECWLGINDIKIKLH